jgi:hypothetical protein
VALSKSERFVRMSTSPFSDARQAVWSPATPEPTTRKRVRRREGKELAISD